MGDFVPSVSRKIVLTNFIKLWSWLKGKMKFMYRVICELDYQQLGPETINCVENCEHVLNSNYLYTISLV